MPKTRDEAREDAMPVIDSTQSEVDEILDNLPGRFGREQSSIIPVLQYTQEKFGYLPEPAVIGIAKYCRVSASTVYGIATFYAQFRFTPIGKNVITVCRGTACHVSGCQGLLDELEKLLGIGPDSTTPDLEFTIQTVACFGSCALAPVILINGKVHGRQTPKSTRKLIKKIKAPAEAEESVK